MFAITIDYLTGVCYANQRAAGRPDVPEWPPHPERLFQALVASSTEQDHDALRWIAAQPAPSIVASDAQARDTLSMFSPANDGCRQNARLSGRTRHTRPPRWRIASIGFTQLGSERSDTWLRLYRMNRELRSSGNQRHRTT